MKSSLRRYTELPFLIDFLMTKELTLLNPANWDDRNDSFYIERYVANNSLKTAFTLCLAESSETYHHWKVFSHGSGGVCIQFHKEILIENAKMVRGLRAESVKYRTIDYLRSSPPKQSELPFLKRHAFMDENEFRLFFGSTESNSEIFKLKMPLNSIDRITLSPWLPASVAENVKILLKSIDGCKTLKIYKSSLVENENWKKFAKIGG